MIDRKTRRQAGRSQGIRAAVLVTWIGLGCAPKEQRPETLGVDPTLTPILPAPEGTIYALGPSAPRDPLVAQVVQVGMLPWQEGLAGAATTLALDAKGPLDLSQARHAAWRAGYPYEVVNVVTGEERPGTFPEGLIDAVQKVTRIGDHVGLVRARSESLDHWVVLVGRPGGIVEPFPRVVEAGGRLMLKADRQARWTTVSPSGLVATGSLPVDLVFDESGEWWVQVDGPMDRRIVGVPVYVGIPPAPGPPYDLPGEPPAGPDNVAADALFLLNEVRGDFRQAPVVPDATLATLAVYPLEQVEAGTWNRAEGEQRLRAAGFVGGPVVQLSCEAPTIELCIDALMADAEGRAGLLHPQVRVGGVSARVMAKSVRLVLNMASE